MSFWQQSLGLQDENENKNENKNKNKNTDVQSIEEDNNKDFSEDVIANDDSFDDDPFWTDDDAYYEEEEDDDDDDNDDDNNDDDEGDNDDGLEMESPIPYHNDISPIDDHHDDDNSEQVLEYLDQDHPQAPLPNISSPPKIVIDESIDVLSLPSPQEDKMALVPVDYSLAPPRRPPPPPPPPRRPTTTTTATTTTTMITPMTTPMTPPPTTTRQEKHMQFVFLSDQKAVPSELKRLQETTRRRRRELQNQHHHVELQIARAASTFAEEKMDLGLAISDTFERSCCLPLEEATERIFMERETVMDRRPAVSMLEKRISRVEQDMMHHLHVELSNAKKAELDSFRKDLVQEIIPSVRIEKSMADKIEGGVIRRYEFNAGLASKHFHQECARRKAELEIFNRQMRAALSQQKQHSEDILDRIQNLRLQLKMEKEERKVADQKLMQDLQKTSIAMRRAFLAAFDDDADDNSSPSKSKSKQMGMIHRSS